MHNINNRLASFKNWPSEAKTDPAKLAEAGFYYTQREDVVRCVYCRVEIGVWLEEDDPWLEHKRWSNHCPLFLKKWCCELKCFPVPYTQVDGVACDRCRSCSYCTCQCETWKKNVIWCCELKCSTVRSVNVDGFVCIRCRACARCGGYEYCRCQCKSWTTKCIDNITK